MALRARRTVVVWRSSRGLAGRYSLTALPRPASTRRLRRLLRTSGLLTAVGLIRLGHALRLRWLPLLAGGALTATGILLNDGAGALAFLAGFLFLFAALVMHVSPPADRDRTAGAGARARGLFDPGRAARPRSDSRPVLRRRHERAA